MPKKKYHIDSSRLLVVRPLNIVDIPTAVIVKLLWWKRSCLTLYHTIHTNLWWPLKQKAYKNIKGKFENAGNSILSFSIMFPIMHNFWVWKRFQFGQLSNFYGLVKS